MDRFRWAEQRDGLLTTGQQQQAGRGKRAREHDRAVGRVRVVRRGVVAVNGSPRTWRQEARAVLLSCGVGVAGSHWTALRLQGGSLPLSIDAFHVTSGLGRQVVMPGVVSHRTGLFEDGDLVERDKMPCTSPLRTVVDLSGLTTDQQLGLIIDDFLRRKLLRLEDLRARVGRLRPAPGRSVARLRRVLAARVPGFDPGESALEARIALVIERSGLPRSAQQHRVTYGRNRFRIDFAWPAQRVYLEGNGFGYHSLSTELGRDARRQNELVLDGWRPIEITWHMTDDEIERTLHRFLDASGAH
jgi:hypothetical protein